MQITELSQDGLSRQLLVTVPAGTINDMVTARLREVAKTVKLPGFRPGKVPLTILKQRYGRSVLGEVVENAVEETSQKAVAEQGVRTAGQPKIEFESFEDGGDLAYKLSFDVLPEFDLIDFSGLKIERVKPQISEDEVDKSVARVAEGRRNYEALAEPRPAQEGDQVVIDFKGTLDGVARDGMAGTDHPLALGSGQFIPGFEDQLVGAEAGSSRTVTVTFPEGYPAEDLAGKEAVFEVDVKEVRAPKETAVDDAFAQSLGLPDLKTLRDMVRGQLEGRYAEAARQLLKRNVLDALAEHYTFDAPPGMVQQEFDAIWKQVEKAREDGSLSADEAARPEEDLKSEYRTIAERRVRLGLVLAEVGRHHHIEVGQDELSRALQAQAARYPGREKEVLELFRKNPNALEGLRAPLLEEKVIDFIVERAEVTDREVTPADLMEETALDHHHDHDHHHHHDHDHDHDHHHHHGHDHDHDHAGHAHAAPADAPADAPAADAPAADAPGSDAGPETEPKDPVKGA
ncbi:MAG: trigger factor [Rhodospirillaceae bacterium]|nr:trigger factor [Rhodospirillaceae bacterium]